MFYTGLILVAIDLVGLCVPLIVHNVGVFNYAVFQVLKVVKVIQALRAVRVIRIIR